VPVRLRGNVGGVVRPVGYSDLEWQATIADAKRLGLRSSAIVPTGTTIGGSSPGLIGAWPSVAILSGVWGPSTKASPPFSLSSRRDRERRSDMHSIWHPALDPS
jgi:hypothetical protein